MPPEVADQPFLYSTVTPDVLSSFGLPLDITQTLDALSIDPDDVEIVVGFGGAGAVTAARVQGVSAEEVLTQLLATEPDGVGLPVTTQLGQRSVVYLPLESGGGWYFDASGDTIFGIAGTETAAEEFFASVP